MQRLKVEHVRLNMGVKEPLQYLIIHALCVHLKKMKAFTMQPLHQGTDRDRGYFELTNFLRIGSKSAVVLSEKDSLSRGRRTRHVKLLHTIRPSHPRIRLS